jgi:hypothetical protein
MVTRENRLRDFNPGVSPEGMRATLLCEDHAGTYLLPFDCCWRSGVWCKIDSDVPLAAKVVGWREAAQCVTFSDHRMTTETP